MPRRGHDFLAAHIGELVDLLAEFGRIGIDRDQILDEAVDLGLQLALVLLGDRNQSRSLLGRDMRHRIGRGQVESGLGRRRGRGRGGRAGRGGGGGLGFQLFGHLVSSSVSAAMSVRCNMASHTVLCK